MSARPSNPVSRLGRYEILGRIASGGMATVYLARIAEATAGFSREFALKVIHPHLVEEDGFAARLLQEARLAARVRHPNVVRTIDSGEDQGYAFMSLELIDGVNLRQLALHRARAFAPPQAAAIVAMVARGLHAVHTATDQANAPLGMVHRDISPHNVMLDRSGRAVLIDLGLAKPDRTTGLTQVGVLAGKLPYMSPEQARVDDLDARSDVFSMGTLLFELTTGELPFGETHSARTMSRLEAAEPGPLRATMEEHALPPWLIEIVLACLRPLPEQRLASAEALAEALAQELLAAGRDEASLRKDLAMIVGDAYDTLGVVEQAEPLPRIAISTSMPAAVRNDESAPHPVTAAPARRWLAVAALVVAVLGLGAWAISSSTTPREATPAPAPDTRGSLSKDQAPEGSSAQAPIRTRERVADPTPPPPAPEPDTAPVPEVPPPKPTPTRSGRKTKSGEGELKPNPYE